MGPTVKELSRAIRSAFRMPVSRTLLHASTAQGLFARGPQELEHCSLRERGVASRVCGASRFRCIRESAARVLLSKPGPKQRA
eukprot:11548326-Alexandrium_andersonii.AAC.1